MWWNQVASLTSDFTVYAMDMLGQPGASAQSKTMFTPTDCAQCIDAVLDGLRLIQVGFGSHGWVGAFRYFGSGRARKCRAMVWMTRSRSARLCAAI